MYTISSRKKQKSQASCSNLKTAWKTQIQIVQSCTSVCNKQMWKWLLYNWNTLLEPKSLLLHKALPGKKVAAEWPLNCSQIKTQKNTEALVLELVSRLSMFYFGFQNKNDSLLWKGWFFFRCIELIWEVPQSRRLRDTSVLKWLAGSATMKVVYSKTGQLWL